MMDRTLVRAREALDRREVLSALALADQAERKGVSVSACCGVRWMCWMLLGRYGEAWRESDRIFAKGEPDADRVWDGSSWTGRRVLIRCVHGLGDTIQFLRMARVLRERCVSVVAQVHPELVRLVGCAEDVDAVLTWEEPEPCWDLQMEVTELPWALRVQPPALPCPTRFRIPPERLRWASRLVSPRDRRRIGVSWLAGPFNPLRTVPLSELAPLGELGTLYCLSLCDDAAGLEPLSVHTQDVLDAAALICQMDVVVTVDTMLAHLAGSLGKPTYLMLPWAADWRWGVAGVRTPWYPSMRLFRQKRPGEWGPVVAAVRQQLE